MATFEKKLMISLSAALIFAFASYPTVSKMVESHFNLNGKLLDSQTGCQTDYGLLFTTLLFFLIIFARMFIGKQSDSRGFYVKLQHTFYSTLIYYFIASKPVYKLTSSIFGSSIADFNGCPTNIGLLLHSAFYCAALVGVMYFPDYKC